MDKLYDDEITKEVKQHLDQQRKYLDFLAENHPDKYNERKANLIKSSRFYFSTTIEDKPYSYDSDFDDP